MTDGDLELLELVVSWVTTVPAMAVVIVRDERRLAGDALARAWPPVSRNVAVFGPWNILSLPVHFARTRRSTRGALLGLAWLAAILAVSAGVQAGVEAAVQGLGL